MIHFTKEDYLLNDVLCCVNSEIKAAIPLCFSKTPSFYETVRSRYRSIAGDSWFPLSNSLNLYCESSFGPYGFVNMKRIERSGSKLTSKMKSQWSLTKKGSNILLPSAKFTLVYSSDNKFSINAVLGELGSKRPPSMRSPFDKVQVLEYLLNYPENSITVTKLKESLLNIQGPSFKDTLKELIDIGFVSYDSWNPVHKGVNKCGKVWADLSILPSEIECRESNFSNELLQKVSSVVYKASKNNGITTIDEIFEELSLSGEKMKFNTVRTAISFLERKGYIEKEGMSKFKKSNLSLTKSGALFVVDYIRPLRRFLKDSNEETLFSERHFDLSHVAKGVAKYYDISRASSSTIPQYYNIFIELAAKLDRPVNIVDYAEFCGVRVHTAQRRINSMLEKELIKRVESKDKMVLFSPVN